MLVLRGKVDCRRSGIMEVKSGLLGPIVKMVFRSHPVKQIICLERVNLTSFTFSKSLASFFHGVLILENINHLFCLRCSGE